LRGSAGSVNRLEEGCGSFFQNANIDEQLSLYKFTNERVRIRTLFIVQ